MLDRVKWQVQDEYEGTQPAPPTLNAHEVLSAVIRQWRTVVLVLLASVCLTVLVLRLWPVRYAATAQVIVNPVKMEAAQQAEVAGGQADSKIVDTQIEIARSGNVVNRVVATLKLVEDAEFGVSHEAPGRVVTIINSIKEQITAVLSSDHAVAKSGGSDQDNIQAAAEKLRRSIDLRRVGSSNVFEIEARSTDRFKAAEIANTIALEYLAEQTNARNEVVEKSTKWLNERLLAIRNEAKLAEDALQEFKTNINKGPYSSARLLQLESQAQSYRKLYDNFLEQNIAADQQISFPALNARVITPAEPPKRKSEPKSLLVLAAGIGLGGILGIAAGYARERTSRRFRSAHDVRLTLNLPCLGVLPRSAKPDFISLFNEEGQQLTKNVGSKHLEFRRKFAPLTLAIVTEANAHGRKVLAFTSVTRGAGVTNIAFAIASSIAHLGKQVLLVDANFRAPELSSKLEQNLSSTHPSLSFLSASAVQRNSDFEMTIHSARGTFDYIVIDGPPLEEGPATLPSLWFSDAVILLIDAETARKSQIRNELESWSDIEKKTLGVVLNKAPR